MYEVHEVKAHILECLVKTRRDGSYKKQSTAANCTSNLYLHTANSLLTLRRLKSYIYMEQPFLMFLDHTQRRSTVGRTPLDE